METSPQANPTYATLIRLAAALRTSVDARSGAGREMPPGRRNAMTSTVLATLTADECRRLIAPGGVGRVLFVDPGRGPVAIPVNYRVDGDDIVFRTGGGAGIADGLRQASVLFDVDHLDEGLAEGWSVLLSGTASVLTDPAELERARALGVDPWAGGDRPAYVRLHATQVPAGPSAWPARGR
jgi:nitroimidazol reductase NimA-like FMN-containing flavoprotein (pyridoxamine 5'-phosphate oxidase superfamily)